MLRFITAIFILVFIQVSCYANTNTAFIVKNHTPFSNQYIFFETNKQSKFYNCVADCKTSKFDKETFQNLYNEQEIQGTKIVGTLLRTDTSLRYNSTFAFLIKNHLITQQCKVSPTGSFSFSDIEDGPYTISIQKNGMKDFISDSFLFEGKV